MSKNKLAILINEDPKNMVMGLNSTLLYMVFLNQFYDKIILIRLDQNPNFLTDYFDYYQFDKILANQLLPQYEIANQNLRENYQKNILNKFITINDLSQQLTRDLLKKSLYKISVDSLNDYDILNRVEPMKAPFPPAGSHNINIFLEQLLKKFPTVHAPLNLSDKEIIDGLSTPTQIIDSNFLDENSKILQEKILLTIQDYQKLYPKSNSPKIVFKPKDSAQSLGVFSLEFLNNYNVPEQENTSLQAKKQQYQIAQNILQDSQKLNDFIKKICQIQNFEKPINELYGEQILIQPFLAGINIGDFRTIIFKDKSQKFFIAGGVFRKKNPQTIQDNNFTTCATTGQSMPVSCEQFEKYLQPFNQKIVDYLNRNSQKYRLVNFVGADIIASDITCQNLWLGELNFHCPALISMIGKDLEFVKMMLKKSIF